MDIEGLYDKELKNLLALCSQMNETLSKLELDFLTHKGEKLLSAINSVNTRDVNLIKKSLNDHNLNVGNTKDSVAEQILKNVKEISKSDIESDVKSQALMTSLNRLMHYKLANLENLSRMKVAPEIKNINEAISSNAVLKTQIFNSIV